MAAMLVAGGAAGAAVGALSGLVLLPVRAGLESVVGIGDGRWPTAVVAVLVAVGVGLDLLALATGRLAPPSIGRQVPREWIEYFSPTTVAVLFGTRLGIGPSTILSTWTWWSVTVAAGLLGLGTATATGAVFGLVRGVTTMGGSLVIERKGGGSVMPRLRARRRPSWAALDLAALLAVALLVSVGCSDRTAPIGAPPSDTGEVGEPSSPDTPPVTNPAQLEDIVRPPSNVTTIPPRSATGEPGLSAHDPATVNQRDGSLAAAGSPQQTVAADPVPLSDDLPAEIAGFAVLPGPETERFLDLGDAAALQPDPTEETALLETRGFRGGWTRAFRNATNDVAVASVYEFADPAQAEFYLEDGLITIGGYGGSFFDIEGLPGVRGFAQSFDDDGEELLSLGAAFQAGSRWYLLYIVGSPDTVTPDVLVAAIDDGWPAAPGATS